MAPLPNRPLRDAGTCNHRHAAAASLLAWALALALLLLLTAPARAARSLDDLDPLDPKLLEAEHEYTNRLIRMEDTAEAHLELAKWCEKTGLLEKAKVHYEQALFRNPDLAKARRSLRALEQESEAKAKPQAPPSPEPRETPDQTPPKTPDAPDEPAEESGSPEGREAHEPAIGSNLEAHRPESECEEIDERRLQWCCAVLLVPAAAVLLMFLVKIVRAWTRFSGERAVRLADVDRMNGHDFERFVAVLLESQGFRVSVTPGSRDFGVDIVARKGRIAYAVQVKRKSGRVGQPAIREAIAGVRHYRCTKAMVITNSYFTESARELASSNGCVLVDRQALGKWITR